MPIYPDGYPEVTLRHVKENNYGELSEEETETWLIQSEDNPHIIGFDIADMHGIKQLIYNMRDNEILDGELYAMMDFKLLKLQKSDCYIFVGTICKTDIDEGFYNIKFVGHLFYDPNLESSFYLNVPNSIQVYL